MGCLPWLAASFGAVGPQLVRNWRGRLNTGHGTSGLQGGGDAGKDETHGNAEQDEIADYLDEYELASGLRQWGDITADCRECAQGEVCGVESA